MVDITNPTEQFHPYQPATATPQTEKVQPTGGLNGILNMLGLGNAGGSLGNVNVQNTMSSVRNYARSNPAKVLGGLAAVAIGAGLMRKRSMS
jgi:hypothetical protein